METNARRPVTAALAAAAGALLLTAVFLARFPPSATLLLETLRPCIGAALVLAAAAGCGRAARFSRLSDAIAAGFPIFGTLCAIVSLLDTRLVVPVLVAAACYGAFRLGRDPRTVPGAPPLLLVPPALLAAACAIVPVNSPDELIYKLAIPKAWLMHGRMLELPLSSNSYLAMALQSADLAALLLGGGIAARLAHLGLYLAAIAIVRRVGGEAAAVMVAWTPALMIIAGWAWSDWGVLAALLLSWERWEHDDVRGASIALGCAIACKYTALPWLLAFAVVVALRRRESLLRVALLVAAFGSFFYLRNLIWTGSPVAPLLLPGAPAVQGFRGSGWLGLVQGLDVFDPRIADEALGILMPLAAVAGLLAWKQRRDLVLVGLIQLPVLLTIAPGSRNVVTGVVPLAIAGAAWLEANALWSWVARSALALALASQGILAVTTLESYEMVPYLAGRETSAQYIARTRRFAAPYSWIDGNTAPDAQVLLLAENRTFYLNRRNVAGGNLDGPRIAGWLAGFPSPAAFHDELRRRGITYVLIHLPWYRVGGPPPGTLEKEYVLQLPPATHAMLMQFLATRATRVYRDPEYVIYRVR